MANWKTAKKAQGNATVNRFNLSKDIPVGSSKKLRLIGDLIPMYVYWVDTEEGRRTAECLSFDRDTQSFIGAENDILVGKLNDNGEPLTFSFAYTTQCIDRTDGVVKVLELKKTVYSDILALASDPEYGDPADPDTGYDISISKESTGPLPINIKYKSMPTRTNSPLTKEERDLELYDLDVLCKRPTPEEQATWLSENTDYLKEAPIVVDEIPVEELADDDLPI